MRALYDIIVFACTDCWKFLGTILIFVIASECVGDIIEKVTKGIHESNIDRKRRNNTNHYDNKKEE